jgi:hypothetical protein
LNDHPVTGDSKSNVRAIIPKSYHTEPGHHGSNSGTSVKLPRRKWEVRGFVPVYRWLYIEGSDETVLVCIGMEAFDRYVLLERRILYAQIP